MTLGRCCGGAAYALPNEILPAGTGDNAVTFSGKYVTIVYIVPGVNSSILIDISQLRIGMYVQLDLGWMHHPFPVSSFRVTSAEQIATLRGLGLQEIRYIPKKSDPELRELVPAAWSPPQAQDAQDAQEGSEGVAAALVEDAAARERQQQLEAQRQALDLCNQRFAHATRQYASLEKGVEEQPLLSRETADALISGCVTELLDNGESVIRLLSEGVGERSGLHPINVVVVGLLLGKALGLAQEELLQLGAAALVHDLGKLKLPMAVAHMDPSMTAAERMRYETHVAESVAVARRMGYPSEVLLAVAQHHEMVDGTGFPRRSKGGDMGRLSHVIALVNRYDRLCNPATGTNAMTPHEALSMIFAQHKARFDSMVLGAFIRMMGVYPPGSVVQLVNDRYAIVSSVNSSRPLRPKVVVHDSRVPREQALILDLETTPELGIRRSLKPSQLPREALEYLSPRQRICYFFERAVPADREDAE